MDEPSLVAAMRFGSRDPRALGSSLDLGRFGLGLKTASLSQCSRFSVISLRDGRPSAATWDLAECERRGRWWLARPEVDELPRAAVEPLLAQGRGTCVVWQHLDRLLAAGGSDIDGVLDAVFDEVADHLAMVFHRFLSGEILSGIEISINGRPLPRIDPFLDGHYRGQALHPEDVRIEGETVRISPFVLPFPSRLNDEELRLAGGRESIKSGHGFYIYRGGRLVVPGGWFKIVPSDQLVRLARVRVDVPIALDHIWKIDIRKTAVEPPPALRPHLRRVVGAVTLRSRRVYMHRGQAVAGQATLPLWLREDLRDQGSRWRVNRRHPLVCALVGEGESGKDIERLLALLENALPLHEIHIHMSNDLPVSDPAALGRSDLAVLARRVLAAFSDSPEESRRFLDNLPYTDPFSSDQELAREIAEDLRQ